MSIAWVHRMYYNEQYGDWVTEVNDGSTTVAKLLDVLGEGKIYGPGVDDDWYKSTYLDEVPVVDSAGNRNFDGVYLYPKHGGQNFTTTSGYELTASGLPPSFDSVEAVNMVSQDVTISGGAVTRVVSNDEVDDVFVTIYLPYGLRKIKDSGTEIKKEVKFNISVTPENGAGVKTTVISGSIFELHKSAFYRQYEINNIGQYGEAPWEIEVERLTEDNTDIKVTDATVWYSYTTAVNIKMAYPYTALMGVVIDSTHMNNRIPTRAYYVKGMKCDIPDNYDPFTREYSGAWTGGFKTMWTNNPAWIALKFLTNKRWGCGLDIEYIDTAALYAIAVYNDGVIESKEREKQSDGSYTETTVSGTRFTFNTAIADRDDAYNVVNDILGSCNSYMIYTGGLVTFIQDRPTDTSYIATNASVIDGMFNYESTSSSTCYTVCSVTWNDPDDMGRQVETLVDDYDLEALERYGYNKAEIVAFGCDNEQQAIRKGRYYIDTNINGGEIVTFTGGMEWVYAVPGEVVEVQDYFYAAKRFGGRVVSATTTSITIDQEIELEAGETYTLLMPKVTASGIHELTLTNSPATTDTLTWSGAIETVPADHLWVVGATNLATRKFRIMMKRELETPFTYEISGVSYDADKYDRVENGIVREKPPTSAITTERLDAPTNFTATARTYTDGDLGNRKYAIDLTWEHTDDPQRTLYNLDYMVDDSSWVNLMDANIDNYTYKDVEAGVYDFRLRAESVTQKSDWVYYYDLNVATTVSGIQPPAWVQVKGGGTTWGGKDLNIEWATSSGSVYNGEGVGTSNLKGYKVEIRKTDDTLLRTYQAEKNTTEYVYTYEMNVEDTGGTPLRSLKVNVYSIDTYDNLSSTCATNVLTNPAPDMSAATPSTQSGPNYITIGWNHPADTDLSHYLLYWGTSSPPTSSGIKINYPGNYYEKHGLEYGPTYYVKVEPWDYFGVGVASQIASETVSKIPAESVDVELTQSVVYSDSEGTASGTLQTLYNGQTDGGGVTHSTGDWSWIQVDFGLEKEIDGVQLWADTSVDVCVATSRDGTTWEYFSGDGSHELTMSSSQYRLTERADLATAKTNYWTKTTDYDYAFFPNGKVARYCRLYLDSTTSKTIYELVFDRIVIAEKVACAYLSAIAADVGNLTAGIIQSSDYNGSQGQQWNLTNGTFRGAIEFISASGYNNITDAPTSLNDINSTEYSNLNSAYSNALTAISNAATAQSTADGKITAYYQSSAPGGADTDDLWFDTDDSNKVYRWNGSSWVSVRDSGIAAAISAANTAQTTADGKAEVFYQTSAPAGASEGDLWYDTDDSSKPLYRYNGSSWQLVADVTSANTAANTSYIGTVPASVVQGWRSGATTYIDGGNILTNSIYLSNINGGTGNGTLNITAGKITISTSDGLTFNSGGNILVNSGADIQLVGAASNPGKLILSGTSYDTEFYTIADGSLSYLVPAAGASIGLYIGYTNRFAGISLYSSGNIDLNATNGIRVYNELEMQEDIAIGFYDGSTHKGTIKQSNNYTYIIPTTNNTYTLSMGNGGTYDWATIGLYATTTISYNLRPYGTSQDLGTSTYYWNRCYTATYYYKNSSQSFDKYDDLQLLDDASNYVDKKTGHEMIDYTTFPDEFFAENEDGTVNKDFVRMDHMQSLSFGAIKQLNREVTEDIYEQFNAIIEDQQIRIKRLETALDELNK